MRRRRQRRKLSMTSLIDVIFLLLLFFMLSSTFSRFAEVELAATQANDAKPSDTKPYFVRLSASEVTVNGDTQTLNSLSTAFETNAGPTAVLISLQDGVSAQRLTDLLVALREVEGLRVTVLGAT